MSALTAAQDMLLSRAVLKQKIERFAETYPDMAPVILRNLITVVDSIGYWKRVIRRLRGWKVE